jgi:hypothetical protein
MVVERQSSGGGFFIIALSLKMKTIVSKIVSNSHPVFAEGLFCIFQSVRLYDTIA